MSHASQSHWVRAGTILSSAWAPDAVLSKSLRWFFRLLSSYLTCSVPDAAGDFLWREPGGTSRAPGLLLCAALSRPSALAALLLCTLSSCLLNRVPSAPHSSPSFLAQKLSKSNSLLISRLTSFSFTLSFVANCQFSTSYFFHVILSLIVWGEVNLVPVNLNLTISLS